MTRVFELNVINQYDTCQVLNNCLAKWSQKNAY